MTFNDIRKITAEEVPLLLPLARSFYEEGNLSGTLQEGHWVNGLKTLLEKGLGFIIVGGTPIRGGIAGLVYQDMTTAEICCMECFWYVSRLERGSLGLRLLVAWEKEAVRLGVKRLIMAHLCSEGAEKFARLYEHRGYKMREQIFVREVTV